MPKESSRRKVIKNLVFGSIALNTLSSFKDPEVYSADKPFALKGNIKHSVCHWCYGSIPLPEFAPAVKKMGMSAVDLIGPKGWDTLKKNGLDSSMCNGADLGIPDGWNHKEFHAKLIQNYTDMIPLVAKAGYTNLITFSGNRRGMDEETGMKNCVDGLKQIMSIAEKNKVMVIMELLNSKVDHKDYMCDKSSWGIELVKKIGSPNFKLLYDIYHMQIDEGDVIRTIKNNHQYFGHYHTGGVPGRNEIDHTQELYYPAIMKAIIETGYKGYVAQEFIPSSKDKETQLASLQKAVSICDV